MIVDDDLLPSQRLRVALAGAVKLCERRADALTAWHCDVLLMTDGAAMQSALGGRVDSIAVASRVAVEMPEAVRTALRESPLCPLGAGVRGARGSVPPQCKWVGGRGDFLCKRSSLKEPAKTPEFHVEKTGLNNRAHNTQLWALLSACLTVKNRN